MPVDRLGLTTVKLSAVNKAIFFLQRQSVQCESKLKLKRSAKIADPLKCFKNKDDDCGSTLISTKKSNAKLQQKGNLNQLDVRIRQRALFELNNAELDFKVGTLEK